MFAPNTVACVRKIASVPELEPQKTVILFIVIVALNHVFMGL
jgi:hypothetical protein